MTTTYGLAPIPIWVVLEPNGTPASGVVMYARSTLNHDIIKNVYQDSGGVNPWPLDSNGGIVFNGNGTQGPFYWENTGIADDLYYLTFYDEAGQLIYTVDDYPQTGGGGSGPVTNYINIDNWIIDGQFSYNLLGSNTLSPVPVGTTVIQQVSFSNPPQNAIGGWFFIKDVTGATDSISIPQTSLSDVTPSNPRNNFVYASTAIGTGTQLDLIFQIPDVKTFSNQQIIFSCQASATGSAPPGVTFEVIVTQYFGSGGSPSGQITTAFTAVWPAVTSLVTVPITVPTVAGMSRGTNNDDFFRVAIRFPIGSTGIYTVTNVMGVQGIVQPMNYIYDTQNEVFYKILDSITNNSLFQTGDIVMNWNGVGGSRPGWASFGTNTTFGNTGTAASYQGQQYFNLYSFLWNSIINTYAPVTPSGRGVSALADWNALKIIQVPPTSSAAAINFFNNTNGWSNGQLVGSSTATLSVANLAPHQHTTVIPYGVTSTLYSESSGSGLGSLSTSYPSSTVGSGTPFSIIPPEMNMCFWIKL